MCRPTGSSSSAAAAAAVSGAGAALAPPRRSGDPVRGARARPGCRPGQRRAPPWPRLRIRVEADRRQPPPPLARPRAAGPARASRRRSRRRRRHRMHRALPVARFGPPGPTAPLLRRRLGLRRSDSPARPLSLRSAGRGREGPCERDRFRGSGGSWSSVQNDVRPLVLVVVDVRAPETAPVDAAGTGNQPSEDGIEGAVNTPRSGRGRPTWRNTVRPLPTGVPTGSCRLGFAGPPHT